MGMTKSEFTRKLMGDKQTYRNKLIRDAKIKGHEADDFTMNNTYRIQAAKRHMKGK